MANTTARRLHARSSGALEVVKEEVIEVAQKLTRSATRLPKSPRESSVSFDNDQCTLQDLEAHPLYDEGEFNAQYITNRLTDLSEDESQISTFNSQWCAKQDEKEVVLRREAVTEYLSEKVALLTGSITTSPRPAPPNFSAKTKLSSDAPSSPLLSSTPTPLPPRALSFRMEGLHHDSGGGLVPDWEQRASHAVDDKPEDDDNDSDEPIGGISDNEGEHDERAGLAEDAKGAAARQTLKKASIRIKHLPLNLQAPFVELFSPLLVPLYGAERPWALDPLEDRVINLFHLHLPMHHPFSSTTQGKKIILKLAEDVLTTWRNKIGQATIEYMENTFVSELDESTPEKKILEKPIIKKNIFCHPIIACAFAQYLMRVDSIPAALKSDAKPSGALIMSIQSAYRAIARWSSGSYVSPPRPFSDFSGDNRGDSDQRDATKVPITLPPYTIQGRTPTRDIERLVNKLTDRQWEEITTVARTFAAMKGKKRARSSSGSDAVSAADDVKAEEVESDFELEAHDADAEEAMDMAAD
ncbi:hypothetical protein CVT26_013514 [Gymnopilus dilepis]|uniref:Uncharacterized protein n=1 Tax=Gymnopilus dilepis TaxID=231916 RepID=A0A409Y5J8_9AGAR|nr:hypothetical protein CVT26_013514 [Gymnopilus dilepis]